MNDEIHLVSLVVMVRPDKMRQAQASINEIEGGEIHAQSEQGKMVVTLEAENNSELVERIDQVQHLPNVLSASLVYHQIA